MRNLKFTSVYAENILCFGPQGVRFHFSDYGQVIQIRGINLDNPGTDDHPASNGAGKSSVPEILSIGLFGRTIKNPTKIKGGQIINALADKAQVEVIWDNYRVVRSFKRTSTGSVTGKIQAWESKDHIWDDESEVTKGGKGVTQDWIDNKLGMNHYTFCNVVVFDDSNIYSFLESDAPTKREFVENVLGLTQYRQYHENAKNLLKNRKKSLEILSTEYELLCQEVESCNNRIKSLEQQQIQWNSSKQITLKDLMNRVKNKQTELETTNTGEQLIIWQQAQEKIVTLNTEISNYEIKIEKVRSLLTGVNERLESAKTHRDSLSNVIQTHNLSVKSAEFELNKQLELVTKLEKLEEGAACPICYGVINKKNYGKVLKHSNETIEKSQELIRENKAAVEMHTIEFNKKVQSVSVAQKNIIEVNEKVAAFEQKIKEYRKEISKLSAINKPEGNSREQVLEAEILELKNQIKVLKDELEGKSPYAEILIESEKERVEKKEKWDKKSKEIKAAEELIPYYQFWIEAFGDRGIRRYIVDGIIPALNTRIAYWLSYLIDGKIELTFNNELEETITRNGNPAVYYSMSNGEIRRINLAVSQSFAYVMMLNSGCCPNVVFLDEVTGGGIDRAGVTGVYNMILELAKERHVFVTTHNENLMSLLQGCETLTLRKENDITVLA